MQATIQPVPAKPVKPVVKPDWKAIYGATRFNDKLPVRRSVQLCK